MSKLTNMDIVSKDEALSNFPAVKVDQRNFRISEIIRRNQAGEQVMGDNHMVFDFTSSDKNPDLEKVNPFNDIGFDLDDVIKLAQRNGQRVTDLQNYAGELKAALDKAKKEEQEKVSAPAPAPAPAPAKE